MRSTTILVLLLAASVAAPALAGSAPSYQGVTGFVSHVGAQIQVEYFVPPRESSHRFTPILVGMDEAGNDLFRAYMAGKNDTLFLTNGSDGPLRPFHLFSGGKGHVLRIEMLGPTSYRARVDDAWSQPLTLLREGLPSTISSLPGPTPVEYQHVRVIQSDALVSTSFASPWSLDGISVGGTHPQAVRIAYMNVGGDHRTMGRAEFSPVPVDGSAFLSVATPGPRWFSEIAVGRFFTAGNEGVVLAGSGEDGARGFEIRIVGRTSGGLLLWAGEDGIPHPLALLGNVGSPGIGDWHRVGVTMDEPNATVQLTLDGRPLALPPGSAPPGPSVRLVTGHLERSMGSPLATDSWWVSDVEPRRIV